MEWCVGNFLKRPSLIVFVDTFCRSLLSILPLIPCRMRFCSYQPPSPHWLLDSRRNRVRSWSISWRQAVNSFSSASFFPNTCSVEAKNTQKVLVSHSIMIPFYSNRKTMHPSLKHRRTFVVLPCCLLAGALSQPRMAFATVSNIVVGGLMQSESYEHLQDDTQRLMRFADVVVDIAQGQGGGGISRECVLKSSNFPSSLGRLHAWTAWKVGHIEIVENVVPPRCSVCIQ